MLTEAVSVVFERRQGPLKILARGNPRITKIWDRSANAYTAYVEMFCDQST